MTSISSLFTSGLTSLQSDALGIVAIILPIGIAITAAVFLAKKGLKWIKGLGG